MITNRYPSHGPCAGSPLTIVGTGLTGTTQVILGGASATILQVTDTMVLAMTLPGSGTNKTLTLQVGPVQTNTLSYDYDPPRITDIIPRNGPTSGGGLMTIIGENFLGLSSVSIGNDIATHTTFSNTSITVIIPPGVGLGKSVVVNAGGQNSNAFPYDYDPPIVSAISPGSGPTQGNTAVTITGQNLFGATAVRLGLGLMNIQSVTHSQIIARTPTGEGLDQLITVSTPSGTALGLPFDYDGPTILDVTPTNGPTSGGTSVTLTGLNLGIGNSLQVSIGGKPATITSQSPTGNEVVVTTPPGTGTNLPISLTTVCGTALAASTFSYNPPILAGMAPNHGPTNGGTLITLTGDNLYNALAVSFGDGFATINSSSHTQIEVVAPPGFGSKLVQVITPTGTSNILNYNYDGPVLTAITPSSGPSAGNTLVTLSGANLIGVDSVTVAGVAATILGRNHSTVTIRTPPGVGLNLPVQAAAGAQFSPNPLFFSYTGGACCIHTVGCETDQCVLETEAECNARGNGTFIGIGVSCNFPCTTTIACCLPTGACLNVTAADCTALGGTSGGSGSDCNTTGCSVTCTCPGDMNLDALINGGDVQAFVNALLSGTPCP